MKKWAGTIVVTDDGRMALQQRENKKGITLPGYVTMFGGTVEEDETPRRAAARELWKGRGGQRDNR